jgi:TonB-dependent starch-binding outer membrane protein SusC
MKKSILIAVLVLLVNTAMAQVRVTGTVTSSEDGSPIPYATILVQGQRGVGATTDLDGNYTIESISPDAVLVFSYIGFITQEIAVNNRGRIDVVMQPDLTQLEEVMVVAYGTATKGTFTGAASVVK